MKHKGEKYLLTERMSKNCPADPRLGYFTFGVHSKDAEHVKYVFEKEPDVERVEIVDGNIRIYYKEITNA
ncbi:hypothetical protein N9245_00355 [bacterium]|nr:hypothetical protein [bacterium]